MVAVQSLLADRPGVLTAARALSHFGEHGIGWLLVSLLGAVLQPRRRAIGWSPGPAHSPPTPPRCCSSVWCGANGRITRPLR